MKYRFTIQLLKRYLTGKASEEEIAKVDKWYKATQQKLNTNTQETNIPPGTKEKIYQRILSGIEQEKKIIPFYKKLFFRVTVAAAVLICFAGLYFLWTSSNKHGK